MSRIPSGMYGGVSAEQRRSERRRKLLDAGLELIAADGWAATSVRRVCQRSGLSSRFFYESFDSLDALAVAIVDEIAADAIGSLVPALADGADLTERIRSGVTALLTTLTDDPRKARVAFVEALGSEPVMKRRLAIMHSLSEILVVEFTRSYPGIEDEAFLQLAALGLVGLVAELLIAWTHGDISRSRDDLIVDVSDLVLANITGVVTVAHRRAEAF